VAIVGEITLRGRVLPVGGLKDKVLAAHRAGIREIVNPERNVPDLEEVPDEIITALRIHPVHRLDQVLALTLAPPEPSAEDDRSGTPHDEARA
jgi:ATP-dependent Lon protease